MRKVKIGVLDDGTVVTDDFDEYVELTRKGKKAIYVGRIRALCGSAGA